jgi:hypothetical protein
MSILQDTLLTEHNLKLYRTDVFISFSFSDDVITLWWVLVCHHFGKYLARRSDKRYNSPVHKTALKFCEDREGYENLVQFQGQLCQMRNVTARHLFVHFTLKMMRVWFCETSTKVFRFSR